MSGFPSSGRPFNAINLGSGLQVSTFQTSTVTLVITHDLGHTVGLRHSEFFNRSISRDGAATNEGDGGVGSGESGDRVLPVDGGSACDLRAAADQADSCAASHRPFRPRPQARPLRAFPDREFTFLISDSGK